jgi:DNA-binding NtrC family response regulator
MNDDRNSRRVRVLAVSSCDGDAQSLTRIFGHTAWELSIERTITGALELMQHSPAPVVVCDTKLPDGTWKDVLKACAGLAHSPYLIVCSTNADDRLWAEALNLGAYDVLAKPFDAKEVFRIIGLAWRRWMDMHSTAALHEMRRMDARSETRTPAAIAAGL